MMLLCAQRHTSTDCSRVRELIGSSRVFFSSRVGSEADAARRFRFAAEADIARREIGARHSMLQRCDVFATIARKCTLRL
jgi:hypothetical protein